LPMLKQRAQTDEDSFVRRAAVEELARNFKDDPDTLPWLKQRAQTDEYSVVRCAALQELAGNFKDDPDTLPILKQRAQTDEDLFVRGAAVEELAKGWKNEPRMFEFFYDIAVNDSFKRSDHKSIAKYETNPRETALEIILKHYPNHPQTLPLLRDRAENDPDEQLRKWAKKMIDSNHQ
ncbi:MAG: HEAT repeat domain-containing protein, partial [Rivularia sp. (in: cyanobacteria)]